MTISLICLSTVGTVKNLYGTTTRLVSDKHLLTSFSRFLFFLGKMAGVERILAIFRPSLTSRKISHHCSNALYATVAVQ